MKVTAKLKAGSGLGAGKSTENCRIEELLTSSPSGLTSKRIPKGRSVSLPTVTSPTY